MAGEELPDREDLHLVGTGGADRVGGLDFAVGSITAQNKGAKIHGNYSFPW
jgi:hypothetical protein